MAGKFKCPACEEFKLEIKKSLDLGSDERSDEVAIQCVKCENCEFYGVTIYEESRRGARDSFYHFGYEASKEQFEILYNDIVNEKINKKEDYYDANQKLFNVIFKP